MGAAFRGSYCEIYNGEGKLLLQKQFKVLELWTEYNGYYITRDTYKCPNWEKQGRQLLMYFPIFIIMELFQRFRDVRIWVYLLIPSLWWSIRYMKLKYRLWNLSAFSVGHTQAHILLKHLALEVLAFLKVYKALSHLFSPVILTIALWRWYYLHFIDKERDS